MAVLPSVDPSPAPFAEGSPLPALRRSAAVAAVGLTVWAALLCSSGPSSSKGETQALPINAPEWTIQRSIDADPKVWAQTRTNTSCDID